MTVTLQQAFDQAAKLQESGRLVEAAELCRQILAQQPGHTLTLHMLGVLCAQSGDLRSARQHLSQAVRLDPNDPVYRANLANVLQEQGELDQAIEHYQRALEIDPAPEIYNNLGNTFQKKGWFDAAIEAYRRAISLRPDFPEAHFNLANALQNQGSIGESIAEYKQAIAHRPQYSEAWLNLGLAHLTKRSLTDAIAVIGRAVELMPHWADAHRNLGLALQQAGRLEEAIAAFEQALKLAPQSPQTHHDLGNALRESARTDEAAAAYRRAISLKGDFVDAHYGLAWTLLTQGDYGNGFAEYESRHRLAEAQQERKFDEPQWDGSPIAGMRILLAAEQGFGDTLFAWRYVQRVCNTGAQVIVRCPEPLHRLLKSQSLAVEVVREGDTLPAFDLQCPMMSLPLVFGTTIQTIPRDVPYLKAEPSLVEKWEEKLSKGQSSRNIGLVWSGKPTPRNRSIPISLLRPLAQVQNIRLHSLLIGDAASQIPGSGLEMIDWSRDLHDFAETAGLIANLDLVITIDTAVAHLAGAMGKPVWVLLQFSPDWRWMLDRADSPWYPTMQLFRQPRPGDWQIIVDGVTLGLRERYGLLASSRPNP